MISSIVQRGYDIAFNVFSKRELFKGCVGLFEIVVDDDVVARARLSRILDLGERSGKTSLDGFFAVGGTAAQSATEGGHVGWCDEEADGVHIGLLDLPDTLKGVSEDGAALWEIYLRIDVEDAASARIKNGADGLPRGTVKVGRELSMLDKGLFCEEGFEFIGRDEMVLFSVCFTGTRLPGRV